MGVIHTFSILGILISTLWGIEVPTVSIALHVCLQFQHFYNLCELGNLDVLPYKHTDVYTAIEPN